MITKNKICPKDIQSMIALAISCSHNNFHNFDLPYRLSSWTLDSEDNCLLWFENDQLVAWAILQTPFWCLDYVIHPQFESVLLPAILDWADQQAKFLLNSTFGRPSWYCNVFPDQNNRIQILENYGYTSQADVGEDSWSKVLMRRFNQPLEKVYAPKPGFIVRPLAGEKEVPIYVNLHQTVFGSNNMRVSWRSRMLSSPKYDPELDIVVQTPDGALAAFCIGWISHDNQQQLQGQIEPLGCHPDYRHLALGRVALCEVIERMLNKGVQAIWVETDNYRNTAFRLYQSFEFDIVREVLVYRKDFP